MVNPGVTPSFFPETMVHFPAAGPVAVSGPFATSATVIGREAMMRLVNQLESGTSSMVLMLIARRFMLGSPGLPSRFRPSS
jgi:hypothetical protein